MRSAQEVSDRPTVRAPRARQPTVNHRAWSGNSRLMLISRLKEPKATNALATKPRARSTTTEAATASLGRSGPATAVTRSASAPTVTGRNAPAKEAR